MLGLLLASAMGSADAACMIDAEKTARADRVSIVAAEEPLSCRLVTVLATTGVPSIQAWHVSRSGGRTRLDKEHVAAREGRSDIGIPGLVPGDRVEIRARTRGTASLTYVMGGADPPAARETHEVRTYALRPEHPGWAFADPARATTTTEIHRVEPDGVESWSTPGAAALGTATIRPGSFTLDPGGARLVVGASPGVTVSRSGRAWRWDAPAGGEARWRVASIGPDLVIPDGATLVAGLDHRFGQASFPEPATPPILRGQPDPAAVVEGLLAILRAKREGALPSRDVLDPRPLIKAWGSTWATSVERALVLQRMLVQERIPAQWLLTGDDPDFLVLTGYDRMLVAARVGDRDLVLDPACRACAWDEFSTRWAGRPAIGAAERLPLPAGSLKRSLRVDGTTFEARFVAEGNAALWLREAWQDALPAERSEALAKRLGMPGGTIAEAEGLDVPVVPVSVLLRGPDPPRRAVAEGDEPWTGPYTED